ncbi:hypothetical protein AALP_AA2G240200 [Arabis alpina]|uniref:VQ domain-containing protein n=1 Tax=Arabis alpina TaxID=50452 RepID=A0A087HJL5_ARAAL|nr:hypothetical protein AALP_AA2G240200 [Arabis alpina]
MASSDGLSSIDPWLYRQGFNVDSWLLPDTFSHDNDLLAKALHTTVTSATPFLPHTLSPSDFFDSAAVSSYPSSTTVSGGSDPDIVVVGAKRKRNGLVTVSDKAVTKQRKFRVSKKSQTTFITTDPSNFRQMVQQITGANYIDDSSLIFKPEPNRIVNRLSTVVPTLDTSAFLSNHHQENTCVGLPTMGKTSATVEASGYDVDTYPTLESWKVM